MLESNQCKVRPPTYRPRPRPRPRHSISGSNLIPDLVHSGQFVHMGTSDMPSGPARRRRVSREDIQTVQNLVELCLREYMNPKEAMESLQAKNKIEPVFTELVWQKLEEENQEFFEAYYLRLLLKEQITQFNRLLRKHAELSQLHVTAVSPLPNSNGTHIPTLSWNSSCYAVAQDRAALKPEYMQHTFNSSLGVFNNSRSLLHNRMHAVVDMSAYGNKIDGPPSIYSTQNSSMGLFQGINGGMTELEPRFLGSSPYIFAPNSNVPVALAQPTISHASVTSFTGVDLNIHSMNGALLTPDISSYRVMGQIPRNVPVALAQPTNSHASVTSFTGVDLNIHSMNGALLTPDISSYRVMGQIPRNVSHSDPPADFSFNPDIMDNYPRFPYLVNTNENFLGGGKQG
ncbi:hypothetical protein RIF29_18469 [Crotalaria pallida]|uniref:Uncharacterized protein n=1 Tax=Crotalaria pallida TaxID=3830 RepID=A0AAN9FQV0_CROPI